VKKAGIIFLIFIIIITLSLKIIDLTYPVDYSNEQELLIEVKKGTTAHEIVDTLYNNGLIKSSLVLKTYINIKGDEDQLKAGYYYLSPAQDMFEILDQLKKGSNAVFKVTIPEGYTVKDIINRLAEKSRLEVEDYTKIIDKNPFKFDFLKKEDDKLIYILEGYLYPDTYTIPLGYNAQKTLEVLLNSFKNNVVKKIDESQIKNNYDLHQLITIASMIEKEAKMNYEKSLVASVIYNRIDKDMRLQIDATVQYVLEAQKKRLFYEDLKIDSVYNTYQAKGLPPGPICNPGQEAIQAALHPQDTDYLFYFALNNGEHVFTDNYQDHLQKQLEKKNEGLIDD